MMFNSFVALVLDLEVVVSTLLVSHFINTVLQNVDLYIYLNCFSKQVMCYINQDVKSGLTVTF